MKGGSDLQKYVDLLVPGAGPTKIRITCGEGPINLVGSHYSGYKKDTLQKLKEDVKRLRDEMDDVQSARQAVYQLLTQYDNYN